MIDISGIRVPSRSCCCRYTCLLPERLIHSSLPAGEDVRMTEMLAQAVLAAGMLPEREQDAIATLILAEIEDERRWTELFERSPDVLAELAREALAEVCARRAARNGRS